jgi:hypothetical protein
LRRDRSGLPTLNRCARATKERLPVGVVAAVDPDLSSLGRQRTGRIPTE